MSGIVEGYLCPECLFNFDSEVTLRKHFEAKHNNNQVHNEVSGLSDDYDNLAISQDGDTVDSKAAVLENLILSLISDTLDSESIPDCNLKSQLQIFLKEQAEGKAENDALISQLIAERDSALGQLERLKQQSESHLIEVQSQLERVLGSDNGEFAEVKRGVKDLTKDSQTMPNESCDTSMKGETPQKQTNEWHLEEEEKAKVSSERQILELRKEVDSLLRKLEESQITVNHLKAGKRDLVEKMDVLSSHLQSKVREIEEKEAAVETLRNNEKALKASLTEAESIIKQKYATIATLEEKVNALVNDVEVKFLECQQLKGQLTDLTAENNLLSESNAKLNVELSEVKSQLTAVMSSERMLNQKLTEMDGIIASQRTKLENHDSIVADLESKLNSTLAEHQALMDQIIDSQNKSRQLETALQTSHQELEGLQRIVLDLGRQNQALQITHERLTNRQWVSDESAQSCSNCQKEFSISVRKHHCRHCGNVFCQACSSKKTATSASKDPLRVCDACFAELTGSR